MQLKQLSRFAGRAADAFKRFLWAISPIVSKKSYESMQSDCKLFIRDNFRLRREKAALRSQLEQAQKNDKRDPKTGRYTKG